MQQLTRTQVAFALPLVTGACVLASACALSNVGLGSNTGGPDAPSGDSPLIDSTMMLPDSGGPPDTGMDSFMSSDSTAPKDAMDSGSDVVSEAMALCLAACTMEGGVCEGEGGAQCSVYCTSTNPCQSVTCPPGLPCFVDCTGAGACAGGIDCSNASRCTTVCGGASNCGSITCGGSDCTVQCQAPGSCANPIDCKATQSCTVECFGAMSCGGTIQSGSLNTSISCQQPGSCAQPIGCTGSTCKVYCTGAGSCEGGECCDASTCSPQAALNLCP